MLLVGIRRHIRYRRRYSDQIGFKVLDSVARGAIRDANPDHTFIAGMANAGDRPPQLSSLFSNEPELRLQTRGFDCRGQTGGKR
jgi:hypothetical protein